MKIGSLAVLVTLPLFPTATFADVYVWNGGGNNGNRDNENNWLRKIRPTSGAQTTVRMEGNKQTATTQNRANPLELNELRFHDSARSFTIGGNPIRLVGDGALLRNNSNADGNAGNMVIGAPVELEAVR